MEELLSDFAKETLYKRYLLRDEDGEVVETPEELWWRIATAVGEVEKKSVRQYWISAFHQRLSNLDFLPNTPTIINAGKKDGQLSACYVLPIEDSMEGIFTTLKNAAIIHKTGGGTGFDFSSLRPEGSMVSNKTGVSTGPLAFCQVYDKATEVVKQGSTRRGANMMNMRVDHPDILEFIDMKMTPGVMTNFNVSVTITDAFMEALLNGENYYLYHPTVGIVGELSAAEVWDKIAYNAWKSAEPGIIFIDRVNQLSSYWEDIAATNPCGEQPLPPYGSCNLGSINVANFVEDGDFNWFELETCIQDAVRFLDNVIDANVYPLKELDDHAKRYRNIGLGIMGWADALIKLKIPYTSQKAIDLARSLQRFINEKAHEYSEALGDHKGVPSGAPFKTHFDYSSPNRRNATLTTIAPTGTISIIAGCSSGIEPVFAFIMERHQLETVTTEYHPLYKAALNNGGVKKAYFVDAHSVDSVTHVDMQAAFQENCDSAISKTINLPNNATVEDVKDAYARAWETGCKGVTVYRDGSREGVLHRKDEPKTVEDEYCLECGTELIQESGCETCPNCAWSKCTIA